MGRSLLLNKRMGKERMDVDPSPLYCPQPLFSPWMVFLTLDQKIPAGDADTNILDWRKQGRGIKIIPSPLHHQIRIPSSSPQLSINTQQSNLDYYFLSIQSKGIIIKIRILYTHTLPHTHFLSHTMVLNMTVALNKPQRLLLKNTLVSEKVNHGEDRVEL